MQAAVDQPAEELGPEGLVDPAIRRSRQGEGTRPVELVREIERLVAIQRRLGILAADVLTRAHEWELS